MSGRVAASVAVMPVTEATYLRSCVVAPTVVIHGTSPGLPSVAAPGPSLPADVATWMPAARALRKPTASASDHGFDAALEPIE